MYISNLAVSNYKCFGKPLTLALFPGMNVITGQNNAGKTALLEAISLQIEAKPHRSLASIPFVGHEPDPISRVDFSVVITRDELMQHLGVNQQWWIPAPLVGSDFAKKIGYAGAGNDDRNVVNAFLSQAEYCFKLRLERTVGAVPTWRLQELPSFGLYPARPTSPPNIKSICFQIDKAGQPHQFGSTTQPQDDSEIGPRLAPRLSQRIYRFSAERFNTGECGFGPRSILLPDASNLPEVLNKLQGNQSRFRHFNDVLNSILPQVRQVSVIPPREGQLEIRVWAIDPESQRIDLTVPLKESGSGIGQVLAILYVVLNSDHPQVVLIDEPQSFLHPGAARKLIEVLREYPQHQFVISTHSPSIIAAADPDTIAVLKLENSECTLQEVKSKERKSLQLCLTELGARLADVFGADNVLWVEGRTEELCFPLIVRNIANQKLLGTAIVPFRNTGDLERRDAQRILEIYAQLSKGNALLPPALGFVFDRECKTEEEIAELQRRHECKTHFLPRRMYENFLLVPQAIVTVANEIEGFRDTPLRPEEVEAILVVKRIDRNFFCNNHVLDDRTWLCHIDAARVLRDIFSQLSATRVAYDKVKHGEALTSWLIDHDPESLRELAEWLTAVLRTRG